MCLSRQADLWLRHNQFPSPMVGASPQRAIQIQLRYSGSVVIQIPVITVTI